MTVDGREGAFDGLSVVTLGEPTSPRQVLAFMGIDAFIEPFERQRFSLLAEVWNAQLTVVDAPGCGSGGARLRRVDRRDLRRGDFTSVARRMVHSAQHHHVPLRRGPVTVVGYSLGSSIAAAAAADPGLLRVEGMILVEPVAVRRWNSMSLMTAVRAERPFADGYTSNNDAIDGAVAPADRRGEPAPHRSRRDLALLGMAVGRGRLSTDLVRAKMIQDFTVKLVHGTESHLSPSRHVTSFVARCGRAGVDVRDVPVPGHHALWHSLPDVQALAELTHWPAQT